MISGLSRGDGASKINRLVGLQPGYNCARSLRWIFLQMGFQAKWFGDAGCVKSKLMMRTEGYRLVKSSPVLHIWCFNHCLLLNFSIFSLNLWWNQQFSVAGRSGPGIIHAIHGTNHPKKTDMISYLGDKFHFRSFVHRLNEVNLRVARGFLRIALRIFCSYGRTIFESIMWFGGPSDGSKSPRKAFASAAGWMGAPWSTASASSVQIFP